MISNRFLVRALILSTTLILAGCGHKGIGIFPFVSSDKPDAATLRIHNGTDGYFSVIVYEFPENCGGSYFLAGDLSIYGGPTTPSPIKIESGKEFAFWAHYWKPVNYGRSGAGNIFSFVPQANGTYDLTAEMIGGQIYFSLRKLQNSKAVVEPTLRERESAMMPLLNNQGVCYK